MDFGIIAGLQPEGNTAYEVFEPARLAMGDTLRITQRVNLAGMVPHGYLSSTGYVLANPGSEYLVLQPDETGAPFTLELPAGSYTAEWYSVISRQVTEPGKIRIDDKGSQPFTAPFEQPGPVVLYLKRT